MPVKGNRNESPARVLGRRPTVPARRAAPRPAYKPPPNYVEIHAPRAGALTPLRPRPIRAPSRPGPHGFLPTSHPFNRSLRSETARNLATGAALQQLRQEGRLKEKPHHTSWWDRLNPLNVGTVGHDVSRIGRKIGGLENTAAGGIAGLLAAAERLPLGQSTFGTAQQRRAERERAGKLAVGALEALGTGGAGRLLKGGALALRGANATRDALLGAETAPTIVRPARLASELRPAYVKGPAAASRSVGAKALRVAGGAGVSYGKFLAGATAAQAATPAGNGKQASVIRGLGGDLRAVGEFPFIGGYQVAQSAVQGAKGNFKPAAKLAKGIGEGFAHGFVGELAQGNLAAAEKALKEHGLISALEVAGVGSIAGRGAGAITRAAGSQAEAQGIRGALARAGSTVRAPIAYTDEAGLARRGAVHQREASPDLIRKAVQMLADKRRAPVLDAQERPVTRMERGRRVTVLKPTKGESERLQQRVANFQSSGAVALERQFGREQAAKQITRAEGRPNRLPSHLSAILTPRVTGRLRPMRVEGKIVPISRANIGRVLVQLVARGTILSEHTFQADLLKRVKQVEDALKHPETFRSRKELRAAQANAAILRRAAQDPRVLKMAPRIVEQGLAEARLHRSADQMLGDLDVHDPAELRRAALSEVAFGHMHARHFTAEDHEAAERAVRARGGSRAEQLEVGGRAPHLVEAHEALQRAHREAKAQQVHANVNRRKAEDRLTRLVSLQRSSRARGEGRVRERMDRNRIRRELGMPLEKGGVVPEGRRRGPRAATKAEQAALEKARGEVETAKQLHAAANQAERGARAEAQASKLPAREQAIRGPEGERLTDEHIEAYARAHGRDPDTIAYLPHVLGTGDPRSYHLQFRPGGRPVSKGQARTGVLRARGAEAIAHELSPEELTAKRVVAAKVMALDKMISEGGMLHPAIQKAREGHELTPAEQEIVEKQGGYMTGKQAGDLAERLNDESGREDWIPVTAFAAKLPAHVQEGLRDAQSPAAMETAHAALLNDRVLNASSSQAANVVLMPAHQVNQLEKQLKPAGEVEKAVQLMNAPFRMAVLPQPRWLAGNFIEPFFVRLPLSGSGANLPGLGMDLIAAHRALRRMDRSGDPRIKQAAAQIRAQQFGGLFIGKRNASIRRTYKDFTGRTRMVLYGAHVLRNAPVLKQLGDLALSIPRGFFHFNRVMETTFQRAAFGKQFRRDVQAFTGNWHDTIRLGKQAVDEAARGLADTATQHRFMEKQHELLGQYDGFNPTLRRTIQSATPFLPWTLAAMRFVFWTLPAHHTVAFDLLMKAGQSVLPEWEQAHKAILTPAAQEGTLRDAPIASDKGLTDVARYTPFGATIPAVHGDYTNLVGTAFPQVQGAVEALRGRDPFGRELLGPGNKPLHPGQKVGVAINSLLESMVPGLATARRLREAGGTPYGSSTILSPQTKPESKHQSALERTFNPFREIYVKPPGTGVAPSSAQQDRELRDAYKKALKGPSRAEEAQGEEELRKAYAEALGR